MQKKRLRNYGFEAIAWSHHSWKTSSKNWYREIKIDQWKYLNEEHVIRRSYSINKRLDKKSLGWNGYFEGNIEIKRDYYSIKINRLWKEKRLTV